MIPIVSQVRGRVLEVPIEEGNRLVHKGDVLFKIDPDAVPARRGEPRGAARARAGRAARDRGVADRRQGQGDGIARRDRAGRRAHRRGRRKARPRAHARRAEPRARRHPAPATRFDLEQAEANLAELVGQRESARSQQAAAQASEAQAQASVGAGQAEARHQGGRRPTRRSRRSARSSRTRGGCSTRPRRVSPCECYVINLQLRPGAFVAGLPLNPVMSLVEADGQIVAFYQPERAHASASRRRGGVRAADLSRPHRQGQGRLDHLGDRPGPGAAERHDSDVDARQRAARAVRGEVRPRRTRQGSCSLPPARSGDAAIYTQPRSSCTSCAR